MKNITITDEQVFDGPDETIVYEENINLGTGKSVGEIQLHGKLERTSPGSSSLRLSVLTSSADVHVTSGSSTDSGSGDLSSLSALLPLKPLPQSFKLRLSVLSIGDYDIRNVSNIDIVTGEIRLYGTSSFVGVSWINIRGVVGVDVNGIYMVQSSGPGWVIPQISTPLSGVYDAGGIVLTNNVVGATFDGELITVTTSGPHGLLFGDFVALRNLIIGDTVIDTEAVVIDKSLNSFAIIYAGSLTGSYVTHSGFWSRAGSTLVGTRRARFTDESIGLTILGV